MSNKPYEVLKEKYIKDLLSNSKLSEIEDNTIYEEKKHKILERALECALDLRKFEIELYWKRATYFWAFIAVIFTAFFAILGMDESENIDRGYLLGISIVGYVFSFSWYLVNRGSKFWQQNWEMHVDLLEDEIMGSIYKTVYNTSKYKLYNILDGYSSSVSKINQLLSIIITISWVGLIFISLINVIEKWSSILLLSIAILISVFISTIILLVTRTSHKAQKTEELYRIREYK